MKTFAIVVLLTIGLIANASEKKIDSKIESVVIFQKGAQVHRTATSYIPKGHQFIRFSNICNSLNPASIQFNGIGDFTIMSVSFENNFLTDPKQSKRIKNIKDSIKQISYDIKYQNQLLAVYNQEISFLKANESSLGNKEGLSLEELKLSAQYYNSRFKEIYLSQLKINEKKESLQKELTKLKQQLAALISNRPTNGIGEIIVEIDAKNAQTAKFEFDYIVYQAGWTPMYNIRAIDISSPVKLEYLANIYQNTGIDWNNTKLTLSTGNPQISSNTPHLNRWYLNSSTKGQYLLEDSESKARYSSSKKIINGNQGNYDDYIGKAKAESASGYVFVNNSQTNTNFEISLPYTIKTGNKRTKVQIRDWKLAANYRYIAIPKLDKDAFLQARITGWEDLSLISGNVNIFFDGTYIGKSYLNTINLNDTLDISLGRDKNIVIKRDNVKDKSSKSVFGSTLKENVAWEISIKNNKSQDINIIIKDQIPLSRTKDIEVELLSKSGADFDPKTGYLVWEIKLDSKKDKKLDFSYQIKYPKELNVW